MDESERVFDGLGKKAKVKRHPFRRYSVTKRSQRTVSTRDFFLHYLDKKIYRFLFLPFSLIRQIIFILFSFLYCLNKKFAILLIANYSNPSNYFECFYINASSIGTINTRRSLRLIWAQSHLINVISNLADRNRNAMKISRLVGKSAVKIYKLNKIN